MRRFSRRTRVVVAFGVPRKHSPKTLSLESRICFPFVLFLFLDCGIGCGEILFFARWKPKNSREEEKNPPTPKSTGKQIKQHQRQADPPS